MADYFAAAMFAGRCHGLYRALEAIKYSQLAGLVNLQRRVVIISARFTSGHETLLSLTFDKAGSANQLRPLREPSDTEHIRPHHPECSIRASTLLSALSRNKRTLQIGGGWRFPKFAEKQCFLARCGSALLGRNSEKRLDHFQHVGARTARAAHMFGFVEFSHAKDHRESLLTLATVVFVKRHIQPFVPGHAGLGEIIGIKAGVRCAELAGGCLFVAQIVGAGGRAI
jgi:hypothetical protein